MDKLKYLIEYLLGENSEYQGMKIPDDEGERFRLFRGLVNVRAPKLISEEFLTVQDEFLRAEISKKGITNAEDLPRNRHGISLWQGDITTLKCGCIVNAANSAMLGCFCPCHGCIDNAIHTSAGVQLRLKCNEIMLAQGHEESTGSAKITPAYNLPCDYILHTVGPVVIGKLTKSHEEQLAECYRSCLESAVENGIKSIAFCCISTGEFHFPNERAAEIAVKTVTDFQRESPKEMRVIFNVFKDKDYEIYRELLGG